MDYGNRESLSPDQIFELPEPYLSPEMLAVPCRLYQWPENVTGRCSIAKIMYYVTAVDKITTTLSMRKGQQTIM